MVDVTVRLYVSQLHHMMVQHNLRTVAAWKKAEVLMRLKETGVPVQFVVNRSSS